MICSPDCTLHTGIIHAIGMAQSDMLVTIGIHMKVCHSNTVITLVIAAQLGLEIMKQQYVCACVRAYVRACLRACMHVYLFN